MTTTMNDRTPRAHRPNPYVVRAIAHQLATDPPAEAWALLADLVCVSWPTLEAQTQ